MKYEYKEALETKKTKSSIYVKVDVDNLKKKFESELDEFTEDFFVRYGDNPEMDDNKLTKEEYLENVDKSVAYMSRLEDPKFFERLVKDFPRNKSGVLNKRAVKYIYSSNNCEYISEWHNTWIYNTVKLVATSDDTLQVQFYRKTDTPA